MQLAFTQHKILVQLVAAIRSDADPILARKCIYAIGCIVRHCALAQQQLLSDTDAIQLFVDLLSNSNSTIRVKRALIALIYDLLVEHESSSSTDHHPALRQAFIDAGICESLLDHQHPIPIDIDYQQKLVHLLFELRFDCAHQISAMQQSLIDLFNQIKLNKHDDDDWHNSLIESLKSIIDQRTMRTEL